MIWFLCLISFAFGFYTCFKLKKHRAKREDSEAENYMFLKRDKNEWKRVYGKFTENKKTKK
jgi:hypothetical protein